MSEAKARIIQESVPGKQITLAHIIANPDDALVKQLGFTGSISEKNALGILTVTPGETAVIAADIAVKASGASVGLVNISSGTVMLTGSVSQVESSLISIIEYAGARLGFEVCEITKT